MYLPNRDFCDVDFSACCMYLFGETKIFRSFSALLKSHPGFEQCLLATKKILYTRTLCNCNMYSNIPVCISSQRYIIKVCLHPDVYLNFTRYMYHFLIQIVILEIYKY